MPFESKPIEKGDRITFMQSTPYNGVFFHHGHCIEYPVEGDDTGLAIRVKLHRAKESFLTLLHKVRRGTIVKKHGEY